VRASRFFVALAILFIGFCAALPFRRAASLATTSQPARAPLPLDLTLRKPDAPLELAPRSDISPATGLESAGGHFTHGTGRSLTSLRTLDPSSVVPTPALPMSFQSDAASSARSDWRPEPLARPRPQSKPRPYRLRDGDTLEKIAERFLDDRARAAEIFEANRDVLARPDLLPVGVTIMLPPRPSAGDLEPVNRGIRLP
jgi:nucleoid-associated protein YgaU